MSRRLPLTHGVVPGGPPGTASGIVPRATRRVALGGALAGALATAACESGGGSAPTPTGSTSPASAGAAPDPDQALLDAARAQTADLLALTTRAARTPGVATAVAPLVHTHRAHLAALQGEARAVAPGRLPGPPLATVRRRESAAQRRYADWAVRARSGALARLLASMSAGLAAHLAALDAAGTPEGGGV